MSDSLRPHGLQSMEFSRPEYWSGSLSLLQGIFPTQGSNPGLPHCRWILYQLSHKGSPRILECVASSFSRGSSPPRNQTGVSCLEPDSLSTELSGKPMAPTNTYMASRRVVKVNCKGMDYGNGDSVVDRAKLEAVEG